MWFETIKLVCLKSSLFYKKIYRDKINEFSEFDVMILSLDKNLDQ